MTTPPRLPINQENLDRLVAQMAAAQESARHAIEANGPKIVAAFESFAKAAGRSSK